jgi:hypothetical protein
VSCMLGQGAAAARTVVCVCSLHMRSQSAIECCAAHPPYAGLRRGGWAGGGWWCVRAAMSASIDPGSRFGFVVCGLWFVVVGLFACFSLVGFSFPDIVSRFV